MPDGSCWMQADGVCQLCPQGTYQSKTGQNQCTKCNVGTYNVSKFNVMIMYLISHLVNDVSLLKSAHKVARSRRFCFIHQLILTCTEPNELNWIGQLYQVPRRNKSITVRPKELHQMWPSHKPGKQDTLNLQILPLCALVQSICARNCLILWINIVIVKVVIH